MIGLILGSVAAAVVGDRLMDPDFRRRVRARARARRISRSRQPKKRTAWVWKSAGSELAGISCAEFPSWAARCGVRVKKDIAGELAYAVEDIRAVVASERG